MFELVFSFFQKNERVSILTNWIARLIRLDLTRLQSYIFTHWLRQYYIWETFLLN